MNNIGLAILQSLSYPSDFRKIFFLQIPVENAWQFYSDFINFIHKGKDTVNVTLHFSFSMNNHASARILTVVYSVQAMHLVCLWPFLFPNSMWPITVTINKSNLVICRITRVCQTFLLSKHYSNYEIRIFHFRASVRTLFIFGLCYKSFQA